MFTNRHLISTKKAKPNISVEYPDHFDWMSVNSRRLIASHIFLSAPNDPRPAQITVLLLFVFAGLTFVLPANFTPFTLAPTAANAGGLGTVSWWQIDEGNE